MVGNSSLGGSASGGTENMHVKGKRQTIEVAAYEFQLWAESARPVNGLGTINGISTHGEVEIYTKMIIRRRKE